MSLRLLPHGALVGDSLADALAARDAARLRRYRDYLDLYEGRHWARPRSGRTNLTLNYARVIVDKGVSYLLGRGLGLAVAGEAGPPEAGRAERAQQAERLLYQVSDQNALDTVDLAAAVNAAVLGDAAFKLFFDPSARRVRVVNVDPLGFFPTWSGEDSSALLRVDLAYRLEGDEAKRLYGVDLRGLVPVVERWTETRFELHVADRLVRAEANPYGFIPFVHIPNLRPPNACWGLSDLADLGGLNRALNERLSDQADLIRYHADPPVIFKGVNDHTDLAVGPGTVWDIPADADVSLLEWRGTAPAVADHLDRLLRAIYEISETPRSAFGDSGRLLSGVALEMELRPLIQKTLRKRVIWTAALRQRAAMILRLAERFGLEGASPGDFAPYRVAIIWPPMIPRDDAREVQNNIALVQAGLRSRLTAMDALGTEDPEQELRLIAHDRTP